MYALSPRSYFFFLSCAILLLLPLLCLLSPLPLLLLCSSPRVPWGQFHSLRLGYLHSLRALTLSFGLCFSDFLPCLALCALRLPFASDETTADIVYKNYFLTQLCPFQHNLAFSRHNLALLRHNLTLLRHNSLCLWAV
jgi:hypothetical protein